jgi:rod shape determining protein RodA
MKFLFSLGVISYIIFQFFVNVGMNMGILPVAGVALPFISYGGSSIMALMISLALIP